MKVNKEKIKEIGQRYNLDLLLLFGSQMKDRKHIHQESDFDIAYLSKRELRGKEMVELNCDLIDIFATDRIDMVNLKRADPLLLKKILENTQLLYGKKSDLAKLRLHSFHRYLDYQKYFDLEEKFCHQFLEQFR